MAGLIYSFYVRWYIGKMATIGDERFHVEAFKAKRPTEYAIWQQFVVKNDFTFNGLYQFVNIAFNQSGDGGHIDRLVAYTEGQQEQLQQSVQVLSTTIENQKQAIGMLEEELELSENAISYLVGLIKKINENLYRLTNDKLELHDMDFITGFSLYRRENEYLKLILDKGTSGASKETLALEASDGQHYAVVDAANSETEEAFSNNPYPGRVVVAFRMKMADNQVWIWRLSF